MSRAARAWTGFGVAGVVLLVSLVLLAIAIGRSAGAGSGSDEGRYYDARTVATVLDVDGPDSYDGDGIDVQFLFNGETEVAWLSLEEGQVEDYLEGRRPVRGDSVEIAYVTADPDDVLLGAEADDVDPPAVAGGTPGEGVDGLAVAGLVGLVLACLIVVATVLLVRCVRRAPTQPVPPSYPRPGPMTYAVPPAPQAPPGDWSSPR